MTTAAIFSNPTEWNEMLYMRQQKYEWGSDKLPFKKYIHLRFFMNACMVNHVPFLFQQPWIFQFLQNQMKRFIYVRQQNDYAWYTRSSVKPHLQIPLHFFVLDTDMSISKQSYTKCNENSKMGHTSWSYATYHHHCNHQKNCSQGMNNAKQTTQKHWIFKGRTHRLSQHIHHHHCYYQKDKECTKKCVIKNSKNISVDIGGFSTQTPHLKN